MICGYKVGVKFGGSEVNVRVSRSWGGDQCQGEGIKVRGTGQGLRGWGQMVGGV